MIAIQLHKDPYHPRWVMDINRPIPEFEIPKRVFHLICGDHNTVGENYCGQLYTELFLYVWQNSAAVEAIITQW